MVYISPFTCCYVFVLISADFWMQLCLFVSAYYILFFPLDCITSVWQSSQVSPQRQFSTCSCHWPQVIMRFCPVLEAKQHSPKVPESWIHLLSIYGSWPIVLNLDPHRIIMVLITCVFLAVMSHQPSSKESGEIDSEFQRLSADLVCDDTRFAWSQPGKPSDCRPLGALSLLKLLLKTSEPSVWRWKNLHCLATRLKD